MSDCLKDFIGICESDCGCTSLPDEKNISTSGLYVTQDPSFNYCRFRRGDTDCDLMKLLLQTREEAYRQLTTDISAILANRIQVKTDSTYFIGQNEYGVYLPPASLPAKPWITIKTHNREGAYIEIQKIALMLSPKNGPFEIDLRVLDDSTQELLNSFRITISGMSVTPKTVVPFRLPCDGRVYRVEYDYDPDAFQVPESQYHCSCGDKLKSATGFIHQNVSQAYGISLYTRVGCDPDLKICAVLANPDYRMVLGYMARKKTIELTLQNIYFRQEVNRFSLLSTEDLQAQIAAYQEEYNERLKWLSFQTNFDVDGFCLTCSTSMRKINLLTGR